MRRKRIFIVLAVCVLVGIGVMAFWSGEREPEYKGKKLSEWIKAYELRFDEKTPSTEKDEKAADEAIRHIGTNSIPWLVRWIAYEPPPWKVRFWRIVQKIPIKSIGRLYHIDDFSDVLRPRLAAERAFEILGPEAAPAVPALTQIIKDRRLDFYAWGLAMRALRSTGKDALPPLLGFLEDANLKEFAALNIVALSDTGVDITPTIPAILMIDRETSAIEKTNIFHSSRFAIGDGEALAAMRHPHFLVSTVTRCLHDTNIVIRVEALNALGRLGHFARPAVPALKDALDDRVIAVQEAAITALEKIAPEVLTNGVTEF